MSRVVWEGHELRVSVSQTPAHPSAAAAASSRVGFIRTGRKCFEA